MIHLSILSNTLLVQWLNNTSKLQHLHTGSKEHWALKGSFDLHIIVQVVLTSLLCLCCKFLSGLKYITVNIHNHYLLIYTAINQFVIQLCSF